MSRCLVPALFSLAYLLPGLLSVTGGAIFASAQDFSAYPEPLVQEATEPHTATVIMLHGLRQTGQDWIQLGRRYGAQLPYVKWIYPTAPTRTVTYQQSEPPGPAWYDFNEFERFIFQEDDVEGLELSSQYVQSIIQQEVELGIPVERISLAGFSQGGALALYMLRIPTTFASVLAFGTYLPQASNPPFLSEEMLATPIRIFHGQDDPLVTSITAIHGFELLLGEGANVTYMEFPGVAHNVDRGMEQDALVIWEDTLPGV